ncbi:hypothetical protein N1851_004139 [Merluccius polli]|uniref:Uncharacterized protein n=1 Tax=Merluccius polli TaxID=89951 RepID=A0AA47N8R8_MERPO|nr:hypothetical protein N1851_004139 [Merluccius polli]
MIQTTCWLCSKSCLASLKGFRNLFRKKPSTWHRRCTWTAHLAVHDTLVSQQTSEKEIEEDEDFVVEVLCGSSSDLLNDSEHLKRRFYPRIDRMTNELENRFSSVGSEVMTDIQVCHPASETFLCMQFLEKLASHYNIQLVPEEVLVAASFLSRKGSESHPRHSECVQAPLSHDVPIIESDLTGGPYHPGQQLQL